MSKILIFAGTSEGRMLIDFFSNHAISITACVATEYGEQLILKNEFVHVIPKRLNLGQMIDLMKDSSFEYVIDATHPYAREVSINISEACKKTKLAYFRIVRSSNTHDDCVYVPSYEAAADYLNCTEGNILLTTGSKNIEIFTTVSGYSDRLFPRILPMTDGIEKCLALGIKAKNIICMQGPFSEEMNIAMSKQVGAKFIVTKDSGDSGGFPDKYHAAKKTGAALIVIGRPTEEEGISLEEAMAFFSDQYDLSMNVKQQAALRFPVFMELTGKKIAVIGAGKIALRRIETLLLFGCEITVIADKLSPLIESYHFEHKLIILRKKFEPDDLNGVYMAIAATDDREVNHSIFMECSKRSILHSIADCKEECDFYFPGIIEYDGGIIGICGNGNDHAKTKRTADQLRRCVKEKENEA